LHHSLGLALIREKRYDQAIAELTAAVKQSPEDARYAYVLGVALYDTGHRRQGLDALEQALRRHPEDRDLLMTLAAYSSEAGDEAAARRYRDRVQAVQPR
jgi:Flp pilus assembly protein TadD